MTHIDKIAEFVFQDLSTAEMAEVEKHLAQCPECRARVEQFQYTYAMLKTSADVEPPRRILFEFERPRTAAWVWRWLAPMAASAAVAFAVVSIAPRRAPQTQIVERVVQQSPTQPVAQRVDYQALIDEIRASDRAWLAGELEKYAAAHSRELQRVRADMASLDRQQRLIERSQWDVSRDVQLLAAEVK